MSIIMVPAPKSYYGLDDNSKMNRGNASLFFSTVFSKTKWRAFIRKLFGKENKLRDLSHIAATAKRKPAKQTGVVTVALDKIVGSEGRVDDFDIKFGPLNDLTVDRWVSILIARRRGFYLQPVDLIQVNDEYYVQDGHHRISVANAVGQKEIEARILYALEVN